MKFRAIVYSICFMLLSMSHAAAQSNSSLVCFNHFAHVLDSATYFEAVNSEFISQFAFSHEKQLKGYKGFYLVGKTNYIELFHSKSFDDYEEEEGSIWICLASLKANYLKTLNKKEWSFIELESNDFFEELSLSINDSISPLATREIQKKQYESWTKKTYHDSITFLPVDYNSPEESDSSSNYLMNDIKGIGLSIHPNDSLNVTRYLNEIGYNTYSEFNGLPRVSNKEQFIELHVSNDNISPTINRYYIQLNKQVDKRTEVIGNSRIECDGKSAIWIFE